jgi:hypothetical protein
LVTTVTPVSGSASIETSGCSRICALIAAACHDGAVNDAEIPPPEPLALAGVPSDKPPFVVPHAVILARSWPNSSIGKFTPPTDVTCTSPEG